VEQRQTLTPLGLQPPIRWARVHKKAILQLSGTPAPFFPAGVPTTAYNRLSICQEWHPEMIRRSLLWSLLFCGACGVSECLIFVAFTAFRIKAQLILEVREDGWSRHACQALLY